jgi:hypothetical protein
MSAVVATINLLLGPLIITISDPCPCRSIGDRSMNCRGVDTSRPLLLRIVVVVRVINDDYFASSREVSTTSEEGPLTGVAPEALPCSNTDEQQWHNETSDGDPGGGGDPDGTGGGVFASSGRGKPSAERER